jgi:apolipoprotein D and lipocalin family protein
MRGKGTGQGKGLARLALPGLAVVTASLLLAGAARRPRVGNPVVPEPLRPVDLSRYLGRWYEFARYDNRFERHCEAVTADYVRRPDGLIRIVNTARRGGPKGRVQVATGRAKIVPGSGNAKLRLNFFRPVLPVLPVFWGHYWILDHDADYHWAVVGEPSGRYLWLLTRQAVPERAVQDLLVARARALGFDTHQLHRTVQPVG